MSRTKTFARPEPDRRRDLTGWRDLATKALIAAGRTDLPAPELAELAAMARTVFERPALVVDGGGWCSILAELAHAFGRQRGTADREDYAAMMRTAALKVSELIQRADTRSTREAEAAAPPLPDPAWTTRADVGRE